jgi:AcrR family transcriptional regulator
MAKGEATREAILDKALSMATQTGLEGLTMGSLAKEVNLSKSGLFAHFQSKEQLQMDVLETAVARFIETVMAPALRERRGEPRVWALFESWLRWEDASFLPGGCPFVAMATELDDKPGPIRDRLVSYQRDWLQSLATSARIAMEEKHFRADLDPDQFAFNLYAIILSYHYYSRLLRDPEALTRVRKAFDSLLASSRA